jgi:hypothetical protein
MAISYGAGVTTNARGDKAWAQEEIIFAQAVRRDDGGQ